jgi:hypothetical protein
MNKNIPYILPILLIGIALLMNCSSLIKSEAINYADKNDSHIGIYTRDSISNYHLSKISMGGYAKQIEIKKRNKLVSVMVVKNDGGGIRDFNGNYINPIRKGKWRIVADTIYIQINLDKNFEEKYLIRGDTLTSINLDLKTQWIKSKVEKTPYNNK